MSGSSLDLTIMLSQSTKHHSAVVKFGRSLFEALTLMFFFAPRKSLYGDISHVSHCSFGVGEAYVEVKRIGALAAGLTGIAVIALPAIWTLPVALPRITNFTFTRCAIAAATVSGIGGTGLPSVVFGTLLGMTGVIRATILTYFTPIVGITLDNVFINEYTALLSVVGMFIVISSASRTSKPDERAVMLSDCTESSSQEAHWWCGRDLGLVL